MRLALSSAAAPGAGLGELLEAAVRRGLPAVELVEGHGHGLDPRLPETAADAARRAEAAGVALAGFRLAGLPDPHRAGSHALARFARALGCPLLLPMGPADDGAVGGWREAVDVAEDLRRAGADPCLLLPAGAEALRALEEVPRHTALAWEADPAAAELAATGSELMSRVGSGLRHIVLRGGGPEAAGQTGRGVGSLMARLAVHGYRGTVALVPGSDRHHVIWDAWLGRRGGWGCGSRNEDRTLVSLGEPR